MRKTIRLAEKQDPAGSGTAWKVVDHRADLLQTMLKAAAEFAQSQRPQAEPESPAEMAESKPGPVACVTAQPAARGLDDPKRAAASPSGATFSSSATAPQPKSPSTVLPHNGSSTGNTPFRHSR